MSMPTSYSKLLNESLFKKPKLSPIRPMKDVFQPTVNTLFITNMNPNEGPVTRQGC